MITKENNNNNGFVVLMVMVVISVALVVGLSVFDIVLREIQISGIERESQKSFYAADSGVECASYWDSRGKFDLDSYDIECAGASISGSMDTSSSTLFTLNFNNGACVNVIVKKNVVLPLHTIIESRGYNVACDSNDFRKVERGIRNVY